MFTSFKRFLLALSLIINSATAWAEHCTTDSLASSTCKVNVEELYPTQFAVGFREVKAKKINIEGFSEEELDTYLAGHPVPVVISPDGKFYITDHHHLARALWDAKTQNTDPKKKLYAEILRNWGNKDQAEFWRKMKEKSWVYLYDEKGQGPISHTKLPENIEDLKDDPYRSLAGEVRDNEGYDKSDEAFAEFKWANFFRARVTIGSGEAGWKKAVKEALKQAKSLDAKNLPGYNG